MKKILDTSLAKVVDKIFLEIVFLTERQSFAYFLKQGVFFVFCFTENYLPLCETFAYVIQCLRHSVG